MLCGYYGEHNLGDDALLEVLLSRLPAGCKPVVTARDERWVSERFGVETCDRRRLGVVMRRLVTMDVLVLGGGSLLQDATSLNSLVYYCLLILTARLLGKRVLLWGQGLGPLRRPVSRWLVRGVLPLATAISWRDHASGQLAERLGQPPHPVGSDPVWAYPRRSWQGVGGPIVLCWRPVKALGDEGWRAYLEALEFLTAANERDLVWLPFHREQDRGLFPVLRQRGLLSASLARRCRELEVTEPDGAMEHFARAGLVVAMRLHGLILAALAGSPVAALSYDPKVAAAAQSLGCPLHDLATPPPGDLAAQWQRVLDQPPADQTIATVRAETAAHDQLLRQVLRPG
ncbi:MAG: polysaccharide pyruvyl transferase CsaB [Cyanobacteriota bacterium]|nr:polysaccharide pyruvyl transferase CsaB [Cyanobacteriota bacterium]